MDMLVSFNRSYKDQFGCEIFNRERVQLRYFKERSLFLFDALANAPLDFGAIFIGDKITKMGIISYLRMNRILRVNRIQRTFKAWKSNVTNM